MGLLTNPGHPALLDSSFAAFETVDFSLPNGFDEIGAIDRLNEVHLRNGCLNDAALKCGVDIMLIELNAIIGAGTSSSSQSTLSVTDVSPPRCRIGRDLVMGFP
ncbi:hypothetical protein [Rhizobium laguerreae]|uniref:Uncharacterized protein n=1 Tax=Rhizobium laguerreae TaxID=1076926 RepID=A0A6N9ZLY6_9HYPH|nr:hypothetical protein [Rhizobium laguerreae]NEH94311.1 hypothetical protein [Rhizobium laguerreae]